MIPDFYGNSLELIITGLWVMPFMFLKSVDSTSSLNKLLLVISAPFSELSIKLPFWNWVMSFSITLFVRICPVLLLIVPKGALGLYPLLMRAAYSIASSALLDFD